MQFSRFITLAASIATAAAQANGFNYGSTTDGTTPRSQADFQNLFTTAQNLVGGNGRFTSARLYTMIQAGTVNTPISAIPAAINTKTSLLLGLWASTGQDQFNNELAALRSAISNYGSAFTDLIVGISVGSEDLYRITPTGIANMAGIGQSPDVLVSYISQVRSLVGTTIAASKPVGHVDTWTAYVNGSNANVISACDFIGTDAYPYFETTLDNSIDNGKSLFYSAYDQTVAVAQGKPVWVTETGWPLGGPTEGLAVASVSNSKTYWDEVGCSLFGTVNTWWYTVFDGTPSPSFGIVGSTLSTQPLFDLTCPAGSSGAGAAASSQAGASSTLATSVQTAATSAATAAPTATQVATSATTAIASLPTAPGAESVTSSAAQAQSTQVQTTQAQASQAQTSAASGGALISQISDGQVQAPTGVPVTQISDGQVQVPATPAASAASTAVVGTPVSQISDGQVQAPTGVPVTQISDGQVQVPATPTASATSTAVVGTPVSQISDGQVQVPTGAQSSAPAASSTGKSCPAALTGTWEYPHLIVPVNKDQPSTAYGTQYFGTINSTVSSIFNFDIPASYAGQTCSLVFLFPTQDQLQTSSYTFSGQGGIDVYELSSPATEQTTYSSAPSGVKVGSLPSVQPGNSYTVTSHECGAGQRVSFEFEATGSLALNYFQDYNPSPIGAYVVAC